MEPNHLKRMVGSNKRLPVGSQSLHESRSLALAPTVLEAASALVNQLLSLPFNAVMSTTGSSPMKQFTGAEKKTSKNTDDDGLKLKKRTKEEYESGLCVTPLCKVANLQRMLSCTISKFSPIPSGVLVP
ncbi:hypothetical protein OUZ56_017061 [Daphnia magna]|uniref:Uncharacterized protein n=1 Tax=Daphnia magna TaxID=35525 RepID=A0ABR0AS40_9CRUS|nr:hypothetical protein OUZ56_017061 [Daphnia magna]